MSLSLYLVLGASVVSLALGAVTWYYVTRARADRAERDAALGEAASATDLASRLGASLQALEATQSKAAASDETESSVASANPSTAGAFLAASTGGVPSSPSGPSGPQGGVPAAPGPKARLVVAGFRRQ